MRLLLVVATVLQVVAVAYGVLLLQKHRAARTPWLFLLATLGSMLTWRIVVSTGITPGVAFNTIIAIWGSVCAVAAMSFFSQDMARRERAEAERDALLTLERQARADAERASRVKDEFMATLSHELRSPLAAILGWCDISRRARTPAEGQRAIDVIERNARMQTRLVDELLDATRLQAGSLHLDRTPVALHDPVSAAVEAARPGAAERHLTIGFDSEVPSPVVIGDVTRIQQIASNLLFNAVKFTPDGRHIAVRLAARDARAELTVCDEGIGIDAAFLPHLFERFRQADTGHTRTHGGLGLGLAIVRSLVELHGGDVQASSPGLEAGATFVVRFPLAPAEAAAAALAPPTTPGGGDRLDGIRVLLVDDDADIRGAVTGMLEQVGATVRALESGGNITAEIGAFRPDVLVLDIGMPGEDGYALMRRVRALPAEAGGLLPAISLTAHARQDDRDRALESGFQAHLPKPVDFPQLAACIAACHAASRGTASAVQPSTIVEPRSSGA